MCGIIGTVGYVPTAAARASALAAIAHRGPDGAGDYIECDLWLGHTLLAITAPPDAARQPMTSSCGKVRVLLNGEVFNSSALRHRCQALGFAFRSDSDTETLLAMYLCFGEDAFATIDGIYAIAIHDARGQSALLWLARDPVGVKQLFVSCNGNGSICFGSELGAVRAAMPTFAQVSQMSCALLLSAGTIPGPTTLFSNIQSLRPGALVRIELAEGARQPSTSDRAVHLPFFANDRDARLLKFPEALQQAIDSQTAGLDEIHLYLSGGIDSAALGVLAAHAGKRVNAYTVSLADVSHGLDEARVAAALCRHMGWRHHIRTPEGQSLRDSFAAFIARMDAPTIDGFNGLLVAQACAGRSRVTFSGTGPDELLSSYSWMVDMLATFANDRVSREALAADWVRRCSVFNDAEAAALSGIPASAVREKRLESVSEIDPGPTHKLVERLRMICLHRFTSDRLLRDTDVTGMAYGLETRVPFLDRVVIDACRGLRRSEIEITTNAPYGGLKRPLVAAVSKYLPSDYITGNAKRGFILPHEAWIRGPLCEFFHSAFCDYADGAFDPIAVAQYWKRFQAGEPLGLRIWLLGTTILWMRQAGRIALSR